MSGSSFGFFTCEGPKDITKTYGYYLLSMRLNLLASYDSNRIILPTTAYSITPRHRLEEVVGIGVT